MLVRMATPHDVAGAVAVDRQAFGEVGLTAGYFEAWLQVFPQGFQVACEEDRIVGYAMGIRVASQDVVDNWYVDTGNGYGSTHNPQGNILYGVSLVAAGALWAGRLLLEAAVAGLGQLPGLEKLWFYGRLPQFSRWYSSQEDKPELAFELAERYVESGRDPLQRYYEGSGFRRLKPVLGYLPDDVDSMGVALKFERNREVGLGANLPLYSELRCRANSISEDSRLSNI
jgi:hypothetical protein